MFKNFSSQKNDFCSKKALGVISPTANQKYVLDKNHNQIMNMMLDVNLNDMSDSFQSDASVKNNYVADSKKLLLNQCRNERSFNAKVCSIPKQYKARSPMVGNGNFRNKPVFFPSLKEVKAIQEENLFKDFPENSTSEVDGHVAKNLPLVFVANPMDLKLIKGKAK